MKKIEVKVEVEEVTGKMYLKQDLGEGTLGKVKFSSSFILPTFDILIEIGKNSYLVNTREIIKNVIIKHINKEE